MRIEIIGQDLTVRCVAKKHSKLSLVFNSRLSDVCDLERWCARESLVRCGRFIIHADSGDGKDCSEEGEMDVMPMIPLFSGVDVIPRTQTACAEPLIKLVEEAPDGVGMVYRVPRP